jgi:hypothetical protein
MGNVKVEYAEFYLEALKNLKAAHDALVNKEFQKAYEYCLDAQTEMRLMTGAVKSWVKVENT